MEDNTLFEEYRGYKPQDFNGVLVILREPNASDSGEKLPADRAYEWIEKVLSRDDMWEGIQQAKDKRAVSRYRHYFEKLLRQVFSGKKDRYHIAFDNIIPDQGGKNASKEYRQYQYFSERVKRIVDTIGPQYVFLCADVYDKIKEPGDKENHGVIYDNKTLRCFSRDGVMYYAIYHPCAHISIGSPAGSDL